jgi:hypothetical protein
MGSGWGYSEPRIGLFGPPPPHVGYGGGGKREGSIPLVGSLCGVGRVQRALGVVTYNRVLRLR